MSNLRQELHRKTENSSSHQASSREDKRFSLWSLWLLGLHKFWYLAACQKHSCSREERRRQAMLPSLWESGERKQSADTPHTEKASQHQEVSLRYVFICELWQIRDSKSPRAHPHSQGIQRKSSVPPMQLSSVFIIGIESSSTTQALWKETAFVLLWQKLQSSWDAENSHKKRSQRRTKIFLPVLQQKIWSSRSAARSRE